MYEGHAIGLVIPAYNEADLVGTVIDAVPSYVDRTYVVDDASTDETWPEIQRHASAQNRATVAPPPATPPAPTPVVADGGARAHRSVVPIRHETNAGRGAAVKTGYRRALDDDMDVVAVVDGDGQMDPTILDRFLDPIVSDRADYAKGDRLRSDATRAQMSRWRLFGNTLLSYLTKVASGYWGVMDPQNGYTAIDAETLRAIDLDALYAEYGFLNDLLVKLEVVGARVVDVPMDARYGDEQSGIRYGSFVPKLSALLLRDYVWRLGVSYLGVGRGPLGHLTRLGGIGMALGGSAMALAVSAGLGLGGVGMALFGASAVCLTLGVVLANPDVVGATEPDDGLEEPSR